LSRRLGPAGIFGAWTVDALGLPAYDYGLDENADPRAGFFNTEGIDLRSHWAAFGNVTIENRGSGPVTLKHYEVWDVGRRPIEINWLVSGSAFPAAPANARMLRDQENGLFDEAMDWDPGAKLLGLRRSFAAGVTPPSREAPSPVDDYSGDPFLVAVVGDVNDVGSAIKAARVNGVPVALVPGATTVTLDIAVPQPGAASTFEVELQ